MVEDMIKEQYQPGGTIHATTNTGGKNDKRKDGIAGILSMKGDRMIPDKFENEVKSGTLFRHWSEEVKSYLKIIDGASMMLINIAEKNPEKKTDKDTVEDYLTGQTQKKKIPLKTKMMKSGSTTKTGSASWDIKVEVRRVKAKDSAGKDTKAATAKGTETQKVDMEKQAEKVGHLHFKVTAIHVASMVTVPQTVVARAKDTGKILAREMVLKVKAMA